VFIAQRLVGPSKQLEQIIQIEHRTLMRFPTGRKQTSWLFSSVAEDQVRGYRKINPGSGRAELEPRTAGLRFQNLAQCKRPNTYGNSPDLRLKRRRNPLFCHKVSSH